MKKIRDGKVTVASREVRVARQMDTDPKAKPRSDGTEKREVPMPARDYQPSKAELEREYDMPGADMATVRRAFFRPVKVRSADKDA